MASARCWDGIYTSLVCLAGASRVGVYGVKYPAVELLNGTNLVNGIGAGLHIKPLGGYTDSVRAGTADVQNRIESVHVACPLTRFLLAGYSQRHPAVDRR